MTTTAPETVVAEPSLEETAMANAVWVGERLADDDRESLQFLKWRPLREVQDVLAAARQLAISATRAAERAVRDSDDPDRDRDVAEARRIEAVAKNTVNCLLDAEQLAKGHTGGPSQPTLGYVPLVYPVSAEEVARLLSDAADATRMLRLPGADRGWAWSHAVDVDPETVEVVVRLRARHPQLPQREAAPTA